MVWQEAQKRGQQVQFIELGEEFRVILPIPEQFSAGAPKS